MLVPDLTLGRVYARLDVDVKSLLYYGKRVEFAAQYYPDPYPKWEINPTRLSLISHQNRRELDIESGFIAYLSDNVGDAALLQEHVRDGMTHYLEEIAYASRPTRLGWRCIFVTEHTSFDELFVDFRGNTRRHDRSWIQVPDYSIRDLGFTSVYYGHEYDGMNLNIGVLNPSQAESFKDKSKFEVGEEDELAIDDGCLMIDLDRYIREFDDDGSHFDRLLSEQDRLVEIAEHMAEQVLKG